VTATWRRQAITRRSDQDGRGAGLPSMGRKPRDQAKNGWRRGKFGNERHIINARRLLRQNAHRRMHERAAGAESAAGAIAVAWWRVIAMIGARMDAMKRTGNARLRRVGAYERKSGALCGCAGNHGMRSKTRRVPVLHGHP
jgi:hypothetical protein